MTTERTYGPEELLLAWLRRRHYWRAHEDLRTYYGARAAAFSRAFGVDLDRAPEGSEGENRFNHRFFMQVVHAYWSPRNPFRRLLAGPPAGPMVHRHAPAIDESVAALREACFHLMLDLVHEIWGLDLRRRVTAEEVRALGFDPAAAEPDPWAYA